jgi:hypothetical protein
LGHPRDYRTTCSIGTCSATHIRGKRRFDLYICICEEGVFIEEYERVFEVRVVEEAQQVHQVIASIIKAPYLFNRARLNLV